MSVPVGTGCFPTGSKFQGVAPGALESLKKKTSAKEIRDTGKEIGK